jgi:hypothetical protein
MTHIISMKHIEIMIKNNLVILFSIVFIILLLSLCKKCEHFEDQPQPQPQPAQKLTQSQIDRLNAEYKQYLDSWKKNLCIKFKNLNIQRYFMYDEYKQAFEDCSQNPDVTPPQSYLGQLPS